jgi:hypothetical protein
MLKRFSLENYGGKMTVRKTGSGEWRVGKLQVGGILPALLSA